MRAPQAVCTNLKLKVHYISLPILGKPPRICQLTSAVFFHRRASA